MNKQAVLIVADLYTRLGPRMGTQSSTDVELLKKWLRALQIEDYELANCKDKKTIQAFEGPILALGDKAAAEVFLAGKKCAKLPHPAANRQNSAEQMQKIFKRARLNLWGYRKQSLIKVVK